MSDLEQRISAALEREPEIDREHCEIRARQDEEGIVYLDGSVPDIAAKRLVPRRVREALGTASVVDHLRLRPEESQPDDRLADLMDQALRTDPVFQDTAIGRAGREVIPDSGSRIVVTAQDGVIGLAGEVISLSHRRLAEAIAWWIPGVCDVDNRVHVVPPESDNDGEISEALQLVLQRDQALDAESVRPRVDNAVVHLEGTVPTREQADRAIRNCWYVPGVHDVRDALAVGPQ